MRHPTPKKAGCFFACARYLMSACLMLMPSAQTAWARAMAAELDEFDTGRAACGFALGCLGLALKLRLRSIPAAIGRTTLRDAGAFATLCGSSWTHLQQASATRLGAASAILAVLAGCVFMASAGAPSAWPWMNGMSLAFALASLALLPRQRLQTEAQLRDGLCLLLGGILLASTGLASSAGLSGRWLRLGPIAMQPVWLLLPGLLLLSGRPRGAAVPKNRGRASQGLLLAMVALLAQGELSWLLLMSLVLLLRCARQPGSRAEFLLGCLALLGAGLASPYWHAPTPLAFVDQVVVQGWSSNSRLALPWLLPAAQLLILSPAWRHRHAFEHGVLWAGIVALSLPGWLPTPLLGMGGSAILGYVLSLSAVPRQGLKAIARAGAPFPRTSAKKAA